MDLTIRNAALSRDYTAEQIGRWSITVMAEDLQVGQGQIVIPDDAGTDNFITGQQAKVVESNTTIVDGFLHVEDTSRGTAKASNSREWVIDVEDPNALLANRRRKIRRPTETDYARVIAFATDPRIGVSGVVDTSNVLNSNTVTMPAKEYFSDDVWMELANDLASESGKTLFIHDVAQGSNIRHLHYHGLTVGHNATLSISDDPSAVNGTTVFAPINPNRHRDPGELRNDAVGVDQTGRVYEVNSPSSKATHNVDGRFHDVLLNITSTSAQDNANQVQRYLTDHKEDRDTYEVTIGPLDGTALARFRAGDFITVTSSVLGLSASSQRIAQITYTPFTDDAGGASFGLWYARLSLGMTRRHGFRSGLPGKGQPSTPTTSPPVAPVPFTPPAAPAAGIDWTVTVPNTGDGGLSAWDGTGGSATRGSPDPTILTLVRGVTYTVTMTVIAYAPNSSDPAERLHDFNLLYRAAPGNSGDSLGGVDWQDSTTGIGIGFEWGPSDTHVGTTQTNSYLYGSGSTLDEPDNQDVQFYVTGAIASGWLCCAGGTISVRVTVSRSDQAGSDEPATPLHGQPVCPEVVGYANGTSTVFATRYPYAPCSLRVFVGGTNQTTEVDETSPEDGTFTFSFAPEGDGETYQRIEAWYQGGM